MDGRTHWVEARREGIHWQVAWYVDTDLVGLTTSADARIRVTPDDGVDLGSIGVRFSRGVPRRATYYGPGDAGEVGSMTGIGGTDLVPEPGSAAADHEDRVGAHPLRHALLTVLGAITKVLVPLLFLLLVPRLLGGVPWPEWDLPSIPTPDVRWPEIDLPDGVWAVLDRSKYVAPIVIAVVLAGTDLRRRRRQGARRRDRRTERNAP